ncbi:cyclin-dependent kinase inhibitor 4-like [Cucurbita pepo subsp. pepo]|uniref:cyclin-dependent kinase inhibitor 4-like n=1 Tax=Cucurbita pepo subsp. pepo TaxID=3664 RepID=UPI000C9D47A8|nr:cyclin-dependent kinase inhibitor 4-like isoform X1 [Cucurbita pepo subsp. pepo]XP_023527273.1 cyclin-dependent kinase inhibitor 4-like [Cucurbita pepo subsp. pepo]
MGKYIRKSKSSLEITLIDASQSSSYIGVRTRAKTLALQRLQKTSNSPPSPSSPATSGSYLQLRSRRLHKPKNIALANESKKQKLPQRSSNERGRRVTADSGETSRLGVCSVAAGSIESVSHRRGDGEMKDVTVEEIVVKQSEVQENVNIHDIQEEASFGENVLDFEGGMSRESTPCSLIQKPESIRTPSSSTKASSTTDYRIRLQNSSATDVPTTREVDDFFNYVEGEQQRKFIEKYNFDPNTGKPLPGRYQWEKMDD